MKDSQKKRITRNLSELQRDRNKYVQYKLKKNKKQNNLSITRNREVKQFYVFLLMMMNSASASLQVL